MDTRQLFSDKKLREEFLDRFPELAKAHGGGASGLGMGSLEGLDSMEPTPKDAERAVARMTEGVWGESPEDDGGLEAIIMRFMRPVHLVQKQTFTRPLDDFPDSNEVGGKLDGGRKFLDAAIPSAGRIEVSNHRLSWLGTGWLVRENVLVTNRHVALEFAREEAGFPFRVNALKRQLSAKVDWFREHDQPTESVFRITKVLHIEPEASFDVALLEVHPTGENGQAQPTKIELATEADFKALGTGAWVGVIGYPAYDSRNNDADQQRIFDGIYNVKRLAPGQLRAIRPDGLVTHDATTLGGNSGSVLIDLRSGKALALHFGGVEGETNFAVQAPRIQALLDQMP